MGIQTLPEAGGPAAARPVDGFPPGAARFLLDEAGDEALGNYFVSNYPPFSTWTAEAVPGLLERLERPAAPGTPLGVYLHLPFCRKRCHFCYFRVYTDRNAEEVRAYLDAVTTEAARLSRTAFGARPVEFLYFGGGTPSYLSIAQLDRLAAGLREALDLGDLEEFAFECEPGTLTPGKLGRLRELGVTRLSLGVEHFDDEILEANNRAHRSKEIHRAFDEARSVGFPQINLDLIAGMLGDSDDRWRAAVEETIRLEPDAVTIYQMESPRNTTFARQIREGEGPGLELADWTVKRRWTAEAFAALAAAGYTRSSAYTAVRDPARARFLYRDRLWRGADMLALGVSSFGHADGWHYQNESALERYLARIAAGESPVQRALPLTDEERMIRQFVLQMKLGSVRREAFREAFGLDILERFGEPLELLERRDYARLTETGPVLTEAGYLRIDRLLPLFFLPSHRDTPYI